MAKPVKERPTVVTEVARAAGTSYATADRAIAAIRDVIDMCLGLDGSIIAPPLMLATASDPVFRRLLDREDSATDEQLNAWDEGDYEATADWLGLSLADIWKYPPVSKAMIFDEVLDRLDIDAGDKTAWETVRRVFAAWRETFASGRSYRIGGVGLERDLEAWLFSRLSILEPLGYPVSASMDSDRFNGGVQWRLADGRRPDIVCRFCRECDGAHQGDWLVIELKVVPGGTAAVDQLAGYCAAIKTELAKGDEQVFGLLICDGASHRVQEYAAEAGMEYLSLAHLGYRAAEKS